SSHRLPSSGLLFKMSEEFSTREKPAHKPPITGYTVGLTLLACIGGLLFGYDTGIMSGIQLFFGKSPGMRPMTTLWVEIIVSITPGLAAIGALVAGKASDKLGRRLIIIFASAAFLVGSIICAAAPSKAVILGGRAVLGVAIGFASMIIPVYISEAAPLHLRGALVTCYQLMIATGFIMANAVAAGFAYVDPVNVGWRLMFGFAAVPSILQMIGFMFLKDTPRYLYSKGRIDEAEAVLTKVYGGDDEWIQYDLSVIEEATRQEEQIQKSQGSTPTISRVFRTPHVRKALLIGCSMQMFQQFVGINSILYYTSEIIKGAGIKDDIMNLWISCGIAAVQSVGTFAPMKLIEKWGRRPTLLTSMAAMVVALAAMGTAFMFINWDTAKIDNRELAMRNGVEQKDWKVGHFEFCGAMVNCDDCVTSPHCGFCHLSSNETSGQCLPLDSHDDARSTVGFCAANRTDYTMSAKSCSTKYTWMPIVFMVFYLLAFAFGTGALPWVYNAEIYPLWARSTCVALSTFTNWTFNLLVSMTFLSLGQLVTKAGSFYVYAVISLVGFFVFWFTVPETKGLGIEEIENLFKSRAVLESEAVSSEEESTESRESSVKIKSNEGNDKSEKEEPQPWFMVSKKALEEGSIDVEPSSELREDDEVDSDDSEE
ncbi:hypothetical protein PRIPAC_72347, partial [Pristionchus pacificus]